MLNKISGHAPIIMIILKMRHMKLTKTLLQLVKMIA